MSQDDEAALPVEGDEELEPLPVEAEAKAAGQTSSKIHAFGAAAAAGPQQRKFTRALNLTGAGATRVRVFHSKITVAAIEHMIDQINEWLDGGELEVKYVNQVVGVVEGKKPEPNLIITVWY
jgi:hypothetical protein